MLYKYINFYLIKNKFINYKLFMVKQYEVKK